MAQAEAHARSDLIVLQVEHPHARELFEAANRPPTPVLEPKALVHLGPDVASRLARDLRHHATRHDRRAMLVHGIVAVQRRETRSLVRGERLGGSRGGPAARRRHGHARLVASERERSTGVVTRRGGSNARFFFDACLRERLDASKNAYHLQVLFLKCYATRPSASVLQPCARHSVSLPLLLLRRREWD